jgi:hypothetical protein
MRPPDITRVIAGTHQDRAAGDGMSVHPCHDGLTEPEDREEGFDQRRQEDLDVVDATVLNPAEVHAGLEDTSAASEHHGSQPYDSDVADVITLDHSHSQRSRVASTQTSLPRCCPPTILLHACLETDG